MQEEKNRIGEVEGVFNNVKQTILDPLFTRYNSFECKPLERFISQNDMFSCYSQLFRIFTEYHQSDDNFQEYIYNQVVKALEMYYKSLNYYTSFVTEGDSIVDCIVCKWEEMQYIKQVINVVLLYVEKNYVSRTDKVPLDDVIVNQFITCIFLPIQDSLIKSILSAIRQSRRGKLASYSPNYRNAVSIILQCLKIGKINVTEEFDNLIINDIYHSYKQVNLNVYSLEGVLRDLDSYCLQEETICNCFGLNHLCKQMQDTMLQCIFASKAEKFLNLHLPSLFPNDIPTLERLYQYITRLEHGVEKMASELKVVWIDLGMKIFNDYQQRIKTAVNPKKVNWEYVSTLAHHFYTDYQIIKEQLHAVSLFYQALYSAVGTVTDHSLGSDYIFATGLAEYFDYRIKKNIVISAEFSKELDELIFIFSNLTNKDEFLNQYTIYLSRRLLSLVDTNYDTERNILSRIRASTGVTAISTMDSIVNDIMNNSEHSLFQNSNHTLPPHYYHFILNVLTKGIWPSLPESEFEDLKHTCNVHCPADMQVIIDSYNSEEVNTERSFYWSFVRGYCNVEITLSNQHSVTIQMLPVQYIILSLFEGEVCYTFKEIQSKTNLHPSLLKSVLFSFVYGKVDLLKKVSGSTSCIEENDSFTYNKDFTTTYSSIRMKPITEERKVNGEATTMIKYMDSYKACIVGYVKKKKSVSYDELMKYTMEKMKDWNIEKDDFTKCIDNLIESEYIERSDKNKNIIVYAYLYFLFSYSTMSKPVVFDDILKKSKDILNDDYLFGTKMAMKIKHIQGVNITAEARTCAGKPVVSKVSSDFIPCDYCNVKKLSIESTGAVVGDVDIPKLINNTTFTLRTLKNYNEAGFKKAAVGMKVMTDSVAFDASFDAISKAYNAGLVYAYKDAMLGLKAYGKCCETITADMGLSYQYNDLRLSCICRDLCKKADLGFVYQYNDIKFSGMCTVDGFDKMPTFAIGLASEVADNTIVRAKVTSGCEVCGCFKTTVNKKMTFTGAMSLDAKNLNNGNHKVGFGVEFLF